MVAKTGSQLLAATALAVLAGAGFSAGSARAQNSTCLNAPNGPAPAGTHWYYKTDQATHQKCWYTRPQDQAAQAAPARAAPSQTAPEQGDTVKSEGDAAPATEATGAPVALAPAAAPPVRERPAPPAPAAPRRAATPLARVPVPTADPRDERPITTAATAMPPSAATPSSTAMPSSVAGPGAPDNIAWPDPPPLPQTAGPGSPFPPPPNVDPQADATNAATAPQAPSADGSQAGDGSSAAAGQPSPATAGAPEADHPAAKADADKPSSAKPPGRISVFLVLAGLIVLLAAGMLLRRVVEHALGQRRVIKLARQESRQEPRLVEPVAVPPPMPTLLRHAPSVVPGHAQTEQRAGEVEDALRKFAQNLRQQRRPAPNGAANGAMGRSGAAVRH